MTDPLMARGLPCNIDAERFVLGSILLDGEQYPLIAGALTAEDFSLEKHRRIFARMGDLHGRGEPIDGVTVYNELERQKEAESCGGLSYLASLDDGMPQIPHLDGYVRILREKSTLRRAIHAAEHLRNRCFEATDGAAEILADAEALLSKLADGQQSHGQWLRPAR
jgi:replicative DNA helicase